jgi:hypothetical protein
MNREQLIDGYLEWLSKYKWAWFGTLTFRGYPPLGKALQCFNKWLGELKEKEDTRDFRWVRVTERGAEGFNVHFHVLIGGLRSGSKYEWMARWQEIAGEAEISYFHAHQQGIRYILKTVELGKAFDIDFDLGPTAGEKTK